MEKEIRDGNVAILISGGFGAGWYSWNSDHEELLYSPKLVSMVENNRRDEITEAWVLENLGISDIYCGGASSLTVYWIRKGAAFSIEEYDGSESIMELNDLTLIA
jgi:hypothetical protein